MKKVVIFILGMLLQTFLSGSCVSVTDYGTYFHITTLYGSACVDEPILCDLMRHAAFERLQYIQQYGVMCYAGDPVSYTRYEHSLGVFFITRKYGAPLEEQIGALLHDVSHTIFSHVGDMVFSQRNPEKKRSYQDDIHEWYLEQCGINDILRAYGYSDVCSHYAKERQRCFHQELPDLSADRIEYNMTGGFLDGLITRADIGDFIEHLCFRNGKWFFTRVDAAKKFAQVALTLCCQRWGSLRGVSLDYHGACALKRAYDIGLITVHDIHFLHDDLVWKKMSESSDTILRRYLEDIKNGTVICRECAIEIDTHCLYGHWSGVDPLVYHNNALHRLTVLDKEYSVLFHALKTVITSGYVVDVTEDYVP